MFGSLFWNHVYAFASLSQKISLAVSSPPTCKAQAVALRGDQPSQSKSICSTYHSFKSLILRYCFFYMFFWLVVPWAPKRPIRSTSTCRPEGWDLKRSTLDTVKVLWKARGVQVCPTLRFRTAAQAINHDALTDRTSRIN